MTKPFEPVCVHTIRGTFLDGTTACEPSRESTKRINWNDSSDRKWLVNHMHWAMMNGRAIQLYAENHAPHTIV